MSVETFDQMLSLHPVGERECRKTDAKAWVVYSDFERKFKIYPRVKSCCGEAYPPSRDENQKTWEVFCQRLQAIYKIEPDRSSLANWIGPDRSRDLTHKEFEEIVEWAKQTQERKRRSEASTKTRQSIFSSMPPKIYLLSEDGEREELEFEQISERIQALAPDLFGTDLDLITIMVESSLHKIFYTEGPLYITEERVTQIILNYLNHAGAPVLMGSEDYAASSVQIEF